MYIMEISYRLAELQDLKHVILINEQCFSEHYSLDEWRDTFRQSICLIAVNCNRIIGYCMAKLNVDGTVYIFSFAVLKDYRRRGVGKSMLERVFGYVSGKNIFLHVRKSNIDAQSLYKKLGFEEKNFIHQFYGDEDGHEYWKKQTAV